MIILLLCSALFSGAETAFVKLRDTDINNIRGNNNLSGRICSKLLDKPEFLTSALLIIKSLFYISLIIVFISFFQEFILLNLTDLPRFIIALLFISFILLLTGEIIPKMIAGKKPLSYALFIAIPLNLLSIILYPLIFLFSSTISKIKTVLNKNRENLNIDELSQAIDMASEDLDDEKDILEGIVNFGSTQVKEIMQPRMKIIGMDISDDMSKVISIIVDSGYSRLPVYDKDFDNITGILYAKDLLPYLKKDKKNNFKWQNLIRDFYLVPETKKISDLLEEFQQKKIHMAIVVDEYGGTNGLITLEDILEEIVGEITDESDTEEALYKKTGKNSYEFSALISINDFCKALKCDPEDFEEVRGEADSLGGLLLEIRGEMPEVNEKIYFKNYVFTIKSLDNRRIKTVNLAYDNTNN